MYVWIFSHPGHESLKNLKLSYLLCLASVCAGGIAAACCGHMAAGI